MPSIVQEFIFYSFAAISTLYVIHLGLYLISANVYDIWHFRHYHLRRRRFAGPGAQAAHGVLPLVSVIISAHNEEQVIERTLDSLRHSTYPRFEVLVADDASHDNTWQLLQNYRKAHQDMPLRVYQMHRNVGKGGALNTLLKRYVRGSLVMTLDADCIVRPDTIANAVAYFKDPLIVGVAANVRIIDEPTVLGVLQKLEHMVGYRSKKMYSLFNCEFVIGGVASTYRMSLLRKVGFYDTDTKTEDIGLSIKIASLGNRQHRMVYAVDVVAMTEGVATFRALVRQRYRWKYGSLQNIIKYRHLILNPSPKYSRSLTLYRMPMALISELGLLLVPLAWGYALYMTFTAYNLTLITGAYITVTAYILLTIWLDENLHARGRLRLSGYALVSYFIFFIMDLVQLAGIIRCLGNSHSLAIQKDSGSTWISPKRIGRAVKGTYEG